MNYVSHPLPMLDGPEKVTGTLRFTADMKIAGLLHTKLVLSSRPHARVMRVATEPAEAISGVIAIFWHANTPQNRYNSSIWYEGQEALDDERMFPPVVRHIGDRVAAVVAESMEIAERAAKLIVVEYADLPAVFDPEESLAQCGPVIDETGEPTFSNPIDDLSFGCGDTAAAFASADIIVESRITTPKTHHCAIETHACIAMPEPGGRILILSPCQSIFAVQVVTAKALNMPADAIRVIKTPIGGSFGGKAEPILDPLCAFFAQRLKRPVLIRYGRQETCIATRMRSQVIGRIRTALRGDGRILGREAETLVDVGAYCTGGNYLPGSMLQRLVRLYEVDNENYRGRAVYTNTTPTGAFRGYGSPQIHTIAEINLDFAARKLKLDPAQLRLKNLVRPGSIEPYTRLDVGNARIRDCVKLGVKRFHWNEHRSRLPQSGRKRIGVGMACAAHINGCFPGFHEATTATLRLKPDNRIDLVCALHDLGCGANTTLAQIAAEVLTIPPSQIDICAADTDTCSYELGTRASRMTYICGEAIRVAAEALKARILNEAGLLLNCAVGDIILEAGQLRRSYGPRETLSLAALAAQLRAKGDMLPEVTETYRAAANPSSYAAHFAGVEVDTLTGLVCVRDYLAVHDIGRAINPMLVEGQIHGGVQIGIGYALYEDVDIDLKTGHMRGDRFSRYHLANAPEMPPVDILLVEKGEPTGPFGAKAVGEITTIPVAAAVVNAVNHALGTSLSDLPLTPDRIIAALEEL